MILDIFIILILVILISKSFTKELLVLDLPVNPYFRGITIDISLKQFKNLIDFIKNKTFDISTKDFNLVNEQYDLKNNERELVAEQSKKLINRNPFFVQKLVELISKQSKKFIDKRILFFKNKNKLLLQNGNMTPIQNNNNYELIEFQIKDQKELSNENLMSYDIFLQIKRPMCSTYYEFEAVFDVFENRYLKIHDIKNLEKKNLIELKNFDDLNSIDINCFNCEKTTLDLNDFNNYMKKKEFQRLNQINKNNLKCSTKNTNDPLICASKEYLFGSNKVMNAGKMYKHQCTKNIECPFYKSNKLYPNNRGGCVDGYCEFPIGIKPETAFEYDSNSNAVCHSRSDRKENCSQQKLDKMLPSLDYAFKNDFNERLIHIKDLEKHNSKVQNII